MTDKTRPSEPPYTGVHRDKHLGKFSSHPFWLERGSDLIRRTLVGGVLFLYFLITYLWLRGQGIDQMIPAFGKWMTTDAGRYGAGIAAFSLGVMAAATFQLRMALRKQDPDLSIRKDAPVSFSPGTAVVIFLVGFVLPLALTFAPGLPFEARFFGALIALTPAATLSFLLPAPATRPSMIPWFSGGVMIPTLALGAASEAAATWLQTHFPPRLIHFFPVLQSLEGIHQSCMALCAMSAVVFAFNLLSWLQGLSLRRNEEKHATALTKEPFWRRLLKALGLGWLLKDEADQAETEADELRRQLVDWATHLAQSCGFSPEAPQEIEAGDGEVSLSCEDPSYDLLFGGHRPTLDQFKALRDFTHLHTRCIENAEKQIIGTGFEMILEGPSGSGRSSVLDAIALLTVLGQGTGTLMLVADAGRIHFAIRRIQERIAALHLAPYVTVGTIQDAWNRIGTGDAPPDICVTTAESWEQWAPGQAVREGPDFDRAKLLMAHYSTVLVDDWMDHPVEVRAHLPFILDKHRIFLESEMLPRASVIAFPSLTETGRNLAVSRLMGDAGVIDENRQLIRLRHRKLHPATVVEIVCDSVDSAVEKLAAAVCQSGQPSILLRKGIDFEEAERQTQDYQTKYQNSKVTVCYCGDQVQRVDGEISSILMKAAAGRQAVLALRAHRTEPLLVVIRVRDGRDLPAAERITPLIVDRSGRGMAESHLRNILRFVSPRSPVHRRCWGQLGLDIPLQPAETTHSRRLAGSLLLDLPELLPEAERRARPYLTKLGSYISLRDPFRYLERVDCHWIADPGAPSSVGMHPNFHLPNALHLHVPDDSDDFSTRSTALWTGNERSELGRTQLHYSESLLLRRQRTFCPDRIREETATGLEIEAAKFRDNGCDAIYPKIEIAWAGEEGSPASLTVATGYGGPAHGFIWADLGYAAGVQVTSRLVERVDDMDRPSPCFGYEYQWHARVRPMLLRPTSKVIEKQKDYQQELKAFFSEKTAWGTGHASFLPGLTYALTRGLEADLPSSAFFGKILAFRLDGPMREFAKAVVWFVEPLGTGRTLSNAVHELLKENGYLQQLATRMDGILRRGWDKSPRAELAKFWLPRSHRKAVSLTERRLVAELLGEPIAPDMPTSKVTWKVQCPHCSANLDWEVIEGSGLQTLLHCDQVISMLVCTTEGQMVSPASLVSAWWPDGVATPSGSIEDKCLAVWSLVADHADYCLDRRQREGVCDCWLPPTETWHRGAGDCEDHSILIASMLLRLGVDAWIVWGKADGSGHAWVEFEIDGAPRLLEATCKKPLPHAIPLVKDAGVSYGFTVYEPNTGIPTRTNGTTYSVHKDGSWQDVTLCEAVRTPDPDPKP